MRARTGLVQELRVRIAAADAADAALDDAFADYIGVNRTDARCLAILARTGKMTAGDLARTIGLTTGAVTVALDRLELVGYARRLPDAQDRRRVSVEVTPKYRRLAEEVYDDESIAGQLAAGLSSEQVELLVAFENRRAELSRARLERLTAKLARRRRR